MFRAVRQKLERIKGEWALRQARRSSPRFCDYLRSHGVEVGQGTFIDSETAFIDLTRPSLVTIGDNCYINRNFTLLTHDYVSKVFLYSGRDFVNSSGRVTIGNNVSFGHDVTVLKGVTIGDDCFIGAGSVVTRDIPSGSVAVGAPCKVICNVEDYYRRRADASEAEAFEYARSIVARFGRRPVAGDFPEEFPLFVSGSEVADYPMLPIRSQLGPSYNRYVQEHVAPYHGLDDFLKAAGIE